MTLQKSVVLGPGEGERIEFQGVEIVFKGPSGSQEGWTVLEYTLPAHQFGAPAHFHHRLVECFYVLEGSLWIKLDAGEQFAGPGSFVMVGPGSVHSFANRTDVPVRFLTLASESSHKAFLMELFALVQTEPVWPPQDPSKIRKLGQKYDTVYV